MKKFDGKVQMLDAGMVLFETKSDFGDTLGQVKAEMEVYGKVLKPADLSEAELPESTGECDLFLDWSSIWRVRYISCHLESADGGESDPHRYAATFKEGNRSTMLRGGDGCAPGRFRPGYNIRARCAERHLRSGFGCIDSICLDTSEPQGAEGSEVSDESFEAIRAAPEKLF